MKVLLVHNFYQSSSPSGEDRVFKNEVALLKKNGITVVTYTRYNDEINDYGLKDRTLLPFKNIWSERTYKELKSLVLKEKPDIAHFHNIWYLISPSAYYACKDSGVPVVQTLHNFRFFCINGLLLRNGKICEACIGKLPWRGAVYGCYRNSRFYSSILSLVNIYHQIFSKLDEMIDMYIVFTEFAKKMYMKCEIPGKKIFVKPNFFSTPSSFSSKHNNYCIFVGRISLEKGIGTLISAFNLLTADNINNYQIKIIGDGSLYDKFLHKADNHIVFLGRKSHSESMKILGFARFMVMPSECYEGFPLTICEAFAYGKPVIASNLGAMAELVDDGKTGLLFEPGNSRDLAEKIKWMFDNEEACIQMGRNARKVFEEKYTAERNFQILMDIYNTVLKKKHEKNR